MLLAKIYFLPSCYALYYASREVLSIIRDDDDDDRYFYLLLFNFIFYYHVISFLLLFLSRFIC